MQIYSKSMKNALQICTSGGDVYYASRNLLSTCLFKVYRNIMLSDLQCLIFALLNTDEFTGELFWIIWCNERSRLKIKCIIEPFIKKCICVCVCVRVAGGGGVVLEGRKRLNLPSPPLSFLHVIVICTFMSLYSIVSDLLHFHTKLVTNSGSLACLSAVGSNSGVLSYAFHMSMPFLNV